jgi:transcriptional regulator with XRE-family HTH domain
MTAPLHLRKIKAEMALKGISLAELAEKAEVNYTVASSILSGRRVDPTGFEKLKATISKFKMPKEEKCAA